MAFAFRLERVLHLRQQEERLHELRLARATQRLQQARRELAARETALAELEGRFAQASRGADGHWLDARQLLLYSRQQEILEALRAEARQQVDGALAAVMQARQELVAAAQRREVLERLRTKARLAYEQAQRVAEGKRLDEVGTIWHYRQQQELA